MPAQVLFYALYCVSVERTGFSFDAQCGANLSMDLFYIEICTSLSLDEPDIRKRIYALTTYAGDSVTFKKVFNN